MRQAHYANCTLYNFHVDSPFSAYFPPMKLHGSSIVSLLMLAVKHHNKGIAALCSCHQRRPVDGVKFPMTFPSNYSTIVCYQQHTHTCVHTASCMSRPSEITICLFVAHYTIDEALTFAMDPPGKLPQGGSYSAQTCLMAELLQGLHRTLMESYYAIPVHYLTH